jgi:hypothetical protein
VRLDSASVSAAVRSAPRGHTVSAAARIAPRAACLGSVRCCTDSATGYTLYGERRALGRGRRAAYSESRSELYRLQALVRLQSRTASTAPELYTPDPGRAKAEAPLNLASSSTSTAEAPLNTSTQPAAPASPSSSSAGLPRQACAKWFAEVAIHSAADPSTPEVAEWLLLAGFERRFRPEAWAGASP